jgi:hypothetical protein
MALGMPTIQGMAQMADTSRDPRRNAEGADRAHISLDELRRRNAAEGADRAYISLDELDRISEADRARLSFDELRHVYYEISEKEAEQKRKEALEFLAPAILTAIAELGTAAVKDVQQIAASQLTLLAGYHQIALIQSSRSFFWALIGSGAGLTLFAVAVAFSLLNGLSAASLVPLVAGAVVQVVSGVVFYLYGKTSAQLSAFHSRLEILQRYMLANSICESLDGEARNTARAALIQEISRTKPPVA